MESWSFPQQSLVQEASFISFPRAHDQATCALVASSVIQILKLNYENVFFVIEVA